MHQRDFFSNGSWPSQRHNILNNLPQSLILSNFHFERFLDFYGGESIGRDRRPPLSSGGKSTHSTQDARLGMLTA